MTSVAASQVFEFLERRHAGLVDRFEISSADFLELRRFVRSLIQHLDMVEGADGTCGLLRAMVSEWLTVPIPYDTLESSLQKVLGPELAARLRWGEHIGRTYEAALRTAARLRDSENPMRLQIQTSLEALRREQQRFRIFCHRRAQQYFQSLTTAASGSDGEERMFLHSVVDYRKAPPFDVLVKVGPLRAAGWGSAPDAIISAPRFTRLIQFVWCGCGDEADFGYDPALAAAVAPVENVTIGGGRTGTSVTWHRRSFSYNAGAETTGEANVFDELEEFRASALHQINALRPATMVRFAHEQAVLYPAQCRLLSLNPGVSGPESISRRVPSESLSEGMYVVDSLLDPVDLGAVRAEGGRYSRIWKSALSRAFQADSMGLLIRLERAGLQLDNLASAVDRWIKPPTTVIHAPQQARHFEILLRVIGETVQLEDGDKQSKTPFWRMAWNEIRLSRGEAIQAGFYEHEIVETELQRVLRNLLPVILDKAKALHDFDVDIPESIGMTGKFQFRRIYGVQEGFRAPEAELRNLLPLTEAERWRG